MEEVMEWGMEEDIWSKSNTVSHSLTQSLKTVTQGRYRAARAAKNDYFMCHKYHTISNSHYGLLSKFINLSQELYIYLNSSAF